MIISLLKIIMIEVEKWILEGKSSLLLLKALKCLASWILAIIIIWKNRVSGLIYAIRI